MLNLQIQSSMTYEYNQYIQNDSNEGYVIGDCRLHKIACQIDALDLQM